MVTDPTIACAHVSPWPGRDLQVRDVSLLRSDGSQEQGHLLVRDGRIAAIAADLPRQDDVPVLQGGGHLLMPGVIDPQVHFRDPGLTRKEDLITASRACLRGGVTGYLEMPNTIPPTVNRAALQAKLDRAAAVSRVHYGFFIGACGDGSNLADLTSEATASGQACGVKMFMGTGHGVLECSDPEVQEQVFATGDKLIAVHAEDQQRILARRAALLEPGTEPAADCHSEIQDEQAALLATRRALELSNRHGRRLHILHLSTGIEAEHLRTHKPPQVTTEVTPQHLVLNRSAYERLGTRAQMNPPLRSERDNGLLWQALVDGVIDCIATDHAPHTAAEKARPYPHAPSGMPGVETALPLMLSQAMAGRCSLADVSRWMSARPAEIYGIPAKGRLEVGCDADLVLVDLETVRTVRDRDVVSKCGWTPFAGWELVGWPVATVVAGIVGFERGRFNEDCRGSQLQFDP